MKPTLLLLVLACYAGNAAALPDRIFADSMEPCCRVGGTVSGLVGTGLVLHLAGGSVAADKAITGNGIYDFAQPIPPGTPFTVSIKSQPSGQSCLLANASTTMGSAPMDNIDAACGGNLIWDQGNWDQKDWN